jgi:serine/threonine protein kinase
VDANANPSHPNPDADENSWSVDLVEEFLQARRLGTADNLTAWADKRSDLNVEQLDQLNLDAILFELGPLLSESGGKPATKAPSLPDLQVHEELGRGGMGVVYKAWQEPLKRFVAVKFIRADRFATTADRERFRGEAEKAASLSHPNLVPVFDFGQHDGQYYFTMQLVPSGRLAQAPILRRYHEDHRAAAELLIKLAGAVQYAHERGIIHRDLKPANILFDDRGEPRVADFGLARRLTDPLEVSADMELDTLVAASDGETPWNVAAPPQSRPDGRQTRTGALIGTPNYMAPEQAFGWDVDQTVKVDVYGLGAILYEILTKRPPRLGKHAWDMILQMGSVPVAPRQLVPRVHRDLEAICLKCLQTNPANRYVSAEAFQIDLRRWLAGEPVHARPIGNLERGRKWIRRNKVISGLAAAVAFVAIFASVKWYEASSAKRATQLALGKAEDSLSREAAAKAEVQIALANETTAHERETDAKQKALDAFAQEKMARDAEARAKREQQERADQVLQLSGDLINDLLDRIEDLPGATPAREALIRTALANLKKLADKADNQPDVVRKLAIAYGRLGDVKGQAREAATGDLAGALASYGESRKLFEKLATQFPDVPLAQRDLATIFSKLGSFSLARDQLADAVMYAEKALAIRQGLVDRFPQDLGYRGELANSHDVLGNISKAKGDDAEALRLYRASQEVREFVATAAPQAAEPKASVSISQNQVGEMLLRQGDIEGALASFRAAFATRQTLVAQAPNVRYRRFLIGSRDRLADLLGQQGNLDEALEICTPGVAEARVLAEDKRNVLAQLDLADILLRHGELLLLKTDLTRALASDQEAVALLETLNAAQAGVVNPLRLVRGYERLGDIHRAMKKLTDATAFYQKAVALVEPVSAKNPANVDYRAAWASVLRKLGQAHLSAGDTDAANTALRTTLELREKIVAAAPGNVPAQVERAVSILELAALNTTLATKSPQQLQSWQEAHAGYAEARKILASVKDKQKLNAANSKWLKEAEDGVRRSEMAIAALMKPGGPR